MVRGESSEGQLLASMLAGGSELLQKSSASFFCNVETVLL